MRFAFRRRRAHSCIIKSDPWWDRSSLLEKVAGAPKILLRRSLLGTVLPAGRWLRQKVFIWWQWTTEALRRVAARRGRAYVSRMADTHTMPEGGAGFRPLLVAAAGVGVLLAGGMVMWEHNGSAVFLEMISAGIAACF